MWDDAAIAAAARHCRRGTRLATWTAAGDVRRRLESRGFDVQRAEGLAPKRHCTHAVFDPRWQPKGLREEHAIEPGEAVVIGSGLAGAAVAASLARRGWRVSVLDAADSPAAGASALPVGLLAPHVSPDDNLLSRLTRAGVRMTLQQARELLREGPDWRETGVMRIGEANVWHEHAAWVKPAALVRAWLAQAGIEWRGGMRVESLDHWRGKLVIVAAALGSQALLGDRVSLHAVRGQIAWGMQDDALRVTAHAVNGNGHFIPSVPTEEGLAWFCGSTYGRNDDDPAVRAEDTDANIERLRVLLPDIAMQLQAHALGAWAGVRCTSRDRRPLVGQIEPGLWASTAMGSRGLTFCVLAAELIAARLHGEPLPLDARLADAIDVARG
jgi:tRNA 5-methylaminomethyl-2-thiouridine biosynthesis bifunctional protein